LASHAGLTRITLPELDFDTEARAKETDALEVTMQARPFDREWLRKDLSELIDTLQLGDEQRHFMRSRWLESLLWMETAAQRTRGRYYAFRLVTVVGAVIVPALVSVNVVGNVESAVSWVTFGLSLVVAVSAAVEGFFRFGERWRHYRALVEELKAEGWSFYEQSGDYRIQGASHENTFPAFVERVNAILKRETGAFIAEIAAPPAETTAAGAPPVQAP
jgi:Protein of unknown function (DUF4231)